MVNLHHSIQDHTIMSMNMIIFFTLRHIACSYFPPKITTYFDPFLVIYLLLDPMTYIMSMTVIVILRAIDYFIRHCDVASYILFYILKSCNI